MFHASLESDKGVRPFQNIQLCVFVIFGQETALKGCIYQTMSNPSSEEGLCSRIPGLLAALKAASEVKGFHLRLHPGMKGPAASNPRMQGNSCSLIRNRLYSCG